MGLGEFSRIERFFRPLATGFPGALGLYDDAALIAPIDGFETVITVDALVEGVHVPVMPPPDLFAHKSIRANLSDLAAKGAVPLVYFLTLALPSRCDDDWVAAFAAALAKDQAQYGIHLAGGDSVSTKGPAVVSITALGIVPSGKMIRRDGAKVGDTIYVTGWIGDGLLGLERIKNQYRLQTIGSDNFLPEERYWYPRPRFDWGQSLRGTAHAAADISDGLVADLEKICLASDVGARIYANQVPLSRFGSDWVAQDGNRINQLITAGDDYELVITGPESLKQHVLTGGKGVLVPIGEIIAKNPTPFVSVIDAEDREIVFDTKGWAHYQED
jgi:thiamine-monophosphate kinase